MNMTKIRRFAARAGALAVCSAALCSVPMMAQGGYGGGGGGRGMMSSDDRVAALDKAVTLTDDQKTKIKAIYEAGTKKMMDLRNSGEDRSTMMPKMQAIRTDENAQVKALLTDDQKPKYDAYLASMPQGRGGRGGGAPGAGAPPPPPPTAPPL
jgi:Spy/CpxP family protein refolding chaperone